MSEILGATLLGLIVQGFSFKLLSKRAVSTLLAISGPAIIYGLLFVAIGAYVFADGGSLDFSKSASVGIPGALIASAIILLVNWSQPKEA